MKHNIPLTVEKYLNFTEDEIEHIDQFLFRFSRLQDTMGDKLFSTLLVLLGENVSNKPFIDILNKLEKLELLFKDEWMELRQVRNGVAHEYCFNSEEIVESLNTIYAIHNKLITIYNTIYHYCITRFKFIQKTAILNQPI